MKTFCKLFFTQSLFSFIFREFWGHDQNPQYESDSSEPEIAKLFNTDVSDPSGNSRIPDSRMTENSVKIKNLTPTFIVDMRKRQQERAERREEIKKLHETPQYPPTTLFYCPYILHIFIHM